MINVFSPCVTYNKINTYDWFKENIVSLADDPDYDPGNAEMAMQKVMASKGLCTGIIYQEERPSYSELLANANQPPIVKQKLSLGEERFNDLLAEYA